MESLHLPSAALPRPTLRSFDLGCQRFCTQRPCGEPLFGPQLSSLEGFLPNLRKASGKRHLGEFPLAHLVNMLAAGSNLQPAILNAFTVNLDRALFNHPEGL